MSAAAYTGPSAKPMFPPTEKNDIPLARREPLAHAREIELLAAPLRERIQAVSRRRLEAAGYGHIDTPIFEDTDLFARGVGESTDIVQKQMFTFEDQGGRSLTLRPEATASVCRAYLEHGMQKLAQPVKLWMDGSFFRHERPQAGRYRQFTQVDAEAIGSDSPLIDAEMILLASDILIELGVEGVRLRLGSLGTPAARAAYLDELRDYLRSHEGRLSDDVRSRLDVAAGRLTRFVGRDIELATPVDPPPGCRLYGRCPLATEICGQVSPPLSDRGGAPSVRAWCRHRRIRRREGLDQAAPASGRCGNISQARDCAGACARGQGTSAAAS